MTGKLVQGWEVVIGFETHAQLSTQSKIFSRSPTAFGAEPNTQASPVDLALLIESARSADPLIQVAAIQALGRLERRDVITSLLPHLRSGQEATREEAAQAIGQSMRGDRLPLDPKDTQVDGVQQALIAAATATNGPMPAVARTLGRLPYTTAEQVARTDAFLRPRHVFHRMGWLH
jgi:hypothetical protein